MANVSVKSYRKKVKGKTVTVKGYSRGQNPNSLKNLIPGKRKTKGVPVVDAFTNNPVDKMNFKQTVLSHKPGAIAPPPNSNYAKKRAVPSWLRKTADDVRKNSFADSKKSAKGVQSSWKPKPSFGNMLRKIGKAADKVSGKSKKDKKRKRQSRSMYNVIKTITSASA